MYDNEKNRSRVFEIYERLFELKKGDIFVSEATSSSSTMISSPMVETSVPKIMLEITVKLNRSNYLLWAQPYSLALRTNWLPTSTSTCYYGSYLCDMAYWRLLYDNMASQQSRGED